MTTLSTVTFLQNGATQQALFLGDNERRQRDIRLQQTLARVSTVTATTNQITSTVQGQLATEATARYAPYQPIVTECPPLSVMELEMRTRNVGVPIPTMTIQNCKGSQFVTTYR